MSLNEFTGRSEGHSVAAGIKRMSVLLKDTLSVDRVFLLSRVNE